MKFIFTSLLAVLLWSSLAVAGDSPLCQAVSALVKPGDIVFIEIDNAVFRRVSRATGGWANHVGIVLKAGQGWSVAESKIPLSLVEPLCRFVNRSANSKVAVRRYAGLAESSGMDQVQREALKRMGVGYDLKFDFDSKKTYCSKFVYEVFKSALGVEIGTIETLGDLMDHMKDSPTYKEDYEFWKVYYGGDIPLQQRILTPQTQYLEPRLKTVFDNSNPTQ